MQQAHILALDDENNTTSRCIVVGGIRDHIPSTTLSLFDLEKGNIVDFKGALESRYSIKGGSTKHVVNGPNRSVAILL